MLHRNVGIQLSTDAESSLRRTERAAMPLRKPQNSLFRTRQKKKSECRVIKHALFGDITSQSAIISCIPYHSAHSSVCFRKLTAPIRTFK
jgi:hypothetical protein